VGVDLDRVMAELESLGTEQNRKIYRRHGANDNQFGVSFANLKVVAKRIKKDPTLAEALWQTGNSDARCLATMIADPKTMTAIDLDRWITDVDDVRQYGLSDLISRNIAGASPQARETAERWMASDREYVEMAGWDVLAILTMKDQSLPDEYFEGYLDTIEGDLHNRKNRVRHAMNGALIAIGMRSERLREPANAVATAIGKVHVDHGETGCKTPDATSYIAKGWTRKKVPA
jgi:3-methyladenine DNA glycosylase AlkD